ncbi:MAG TPA: tyrosine-type recombinase/integrase [Xanthobacteraceae bacterium]
MREHVTMMRSLGYRYIGAEGMLHRFDRFLQGRPDLKDKPLTTLIEAWRQAGTGAQHALEAQQCGRMLSKAQARLDPRGIIEVRETKFFKSRRLPLAPSVVSALQAYLRERRKAGAPAGAAAALFWHQQEGGRYSSKTAWHLMVEVLRLSGIKPPQGRIGPRIHDLRHAMVCNRMLAWYRQGINPQARLAHLATFLGHRDINSTLVYLTITPKLLHFANERFRQHGVHVLRNTDNMS